MYKENKIFNYIKKEDNIYFSKVFDTDLVELINAYYLEYRSSLYLKKENTFGTEIEFEYANIEEIADTITDLLGKGWKTDFDFSVFYTDGGEVDSPICRDEVKCWRDLKIACNIIKKYASIGENSAGHIHVGAHILGEDIKTWLNFIKIWSVYEHIIFRFLYGEYLTGRPTLPYYAREVKEEFWNIYIKFNNSRYFSLKDLLNKLKLVGNCRAINFFNVKEVGTFQENNTIEFRSPNGSLEPIIWQNNINLLVKLLEYAKSNNYDDDIINARYKANKRKYIDYDNIWLDQALEFCDLIFDNNLDKVYFLRQYLKNCIVNSSGYTKAKCFIKK